MERAGVNATRSFLEAHECAVQEVDTGSDYGKDLLVDLTEDLEITGEYIALQVKGGTSFFQSGHWGIRAKLTDLSLWLDSSIPVFGVIYDPKAEDLHWMNLSAYAREEMRAHQEFARPGDLNIQEADALPGHFVAFPDDQVLNDETWPAFRNSVRSYLERFQGHSLLNLVSTDAQQQATAVADCYALGRGDARALLMVRHLIHQLTGPGLHAGVTLLSYCTSHPDIFWRKENWVPQRIKDAVVSTFSWRADEIFHMIREIEKYDEPWRWERGSSGQCLFLILLKDSNLPSKLRTAVRMACSAGETQVAIIMLYLYQYHMAANMPDDVNILEEVEQVVAENPNLASDVLTRELLQIIADHGWADIF